MISQLKIRTAAAFSIMVLAGSAPQYLSSRGYTQELEEAFVAKIRETREKRGLSDSFLDQSFDSSMGQAPEIGKQVALELKEIRDDMLRLLASTEWTPIEEFIKRMNLAEKKLKSFSQKNRNELQKKMQSGKGKEKPDTAENISKKNEEKEEEEEEEETEKKREDKNEAESLAVRMPPQESDTKKMEGKISSAPLNVQVPEAITPPTPVQPMEPTKPVEPVKPVPEKPQGMMIPIATPSAPQRPTVTTMALPTPKRSPAVPQATTPPPGAAPADQAVGSAAIEIFEG